MILEPVSMSGNKTASAAIRTRPGTLAVIDLSPPASGVVVLTIYDHATAASGTVIARIDLASGSNSINGLQCARSYANGLYAELSGTYTGTINFNIGYITG
jgi:hypothetical protein